MDGMDGFDDEISILQFRSGLGRAKSAKNIAYVLENEGFWNELLRVDNTVHSVQAGHNDTFIQLSATNPFTGEKIDLPPARLKSLFHKTKQ